MFPITKIKIPMMQPAMNANMSKLLPHGLIGYSSMSATEGVEKFVGSMSSSSNVVVTSIVWLKSSVMFVVAKVDSVRS